MLEDKAIRGIPWTFLSYAGNRVVFLATTIVLARLLTPRDFGLVALAIVAVGLVSLLSGLGLGAALVVRQDLDRRAEGTVLTLLVGTGISLAALLAVFAPVAARLFGEPRLDEVLVVMAAMVAVSGLNWFYESLLQRELEFRRRFAALMSQALAMAVVSIALALLGAGVWALVAGQIAGAAAYGAALVVLAPYRVRPDFDPVAARDVLRTGQGFVLQGAAAFVFQNADYVAVGRVLGAAPLGFYTLAYRVSEVPYWAVVDPVAKVTFPAFSRLRGRGEDVTAPFLSTLALVGLVACPLGVLLSATADPFTRMIFGEKWLPMIGPLGVLGIWAAVRALTTTTAWLLNSVGHANVVALLTALFLAPLVAGLVLATPHGITAVAWVLVGTMLLEWLAVGLLAERKVGVSFLRQLRALGPIIPASVASWLAGRAAVELVPEGSPAVALVAGVAGGVAAYLLVIVAVQPSLLGHAATQARRMLGRAAPEGTSR